MKTRILICSSLFLFGLCADLSGQKVFTSYLWHMDQPVYWGERSSDKPGSKQFAEESHRLKMSGANRYPGSNVPHPTNDLQEIFSKDDRVKAYQTSPRDAINSILNHPDAGAQLSISAGLLENIRSLAVKNQWGYSSGWMDPYKEVIGKKTSGGYPRLDVVGFTYDHALSPLVSERTLKKQIQGHQYVSNKYYGYTSPGYWPAECAFSERIIKVLTESGITWSVIANSRLARTLSDYVHPYNINGNIDPPNRADMVPTQGINWFDGAIDGRGSRLAAPYCYRAHKARYIDPSTGIEYKIDVVPMCNYLSYIDGYSGASAEDVEKLIAPYSDESHPSIVLLAHDGDNAWGGGYDYYNNAVKNFTNAAAGKGYKPATIRQFLHDHPVPENDIVRVEDGSWVNAENDWGHPQFINWLWPLYTSDQRFDPDGWTEDARNWAVITATENYVITAEDITGELSVANICEGGAAANDAEKAWHFYFGGLNSGFMYYGKAEDMEVKPSLTGNIAIEYAQRVIDANAGKDETAPSVFIPQRYPYNPGGTGRGPTTGYKKVDYSSDFTVWTFAYDISGLSSVKLKYRTDKDGIRSLTEKDNETYAGGPGVNEWMEKEMIRKPMASDPTNDPELNFFILPKAKADLCYAEIAGLSEVLVDYYVEAVDTKGNSFKTPIQHVYVGTSNTTDPEDPHTLPDYIEIDPQKPSYNDEITVIMKTGFVPGKNLYWGKNSSFSDPTTTPFVLQNGRYVAKIGPFDEQVNMIKFCINTNGQDWDNNNGNDYIIKLTTPSENDNPKGSNISKNVDENDTYVFSISDFNFVSPPGNTFKGIKIRSLPETGNLRSDGTDVFVDQLITNIETFSYTASNRSAVFTYQIVDSQDLTSDAIYKAAFTVNSIGSGITVTLKKPADWNDVYVWAWTGDINHTGGIWPGKPAIDNGNGTYSYTFDENIEIVNVVFSDNGNSQSTDITDILVTTCYEENGREQNKIKVKVIDCSSASDIENKYSDPLLKLSVYPSPMNDHCIIDLPNTGDNGTFRLALYDPMGQMIRTDHFNGNTYVLRRNNLPAGIYFAEIINGSGTQSYKIKLSVR